MTQTLIVAVLVGLAALYCLWYLLPAAARKRLGRVHRLLARAPACASGSCSDCGKCPSSVAGESSGTNVTTQPIIFHRRV